MVVWCEFFIGESDYINSPCWSIIRIERITTPNAHPNKLVSTFNYAKNCDELNLMLLDTFDKMGYSKPSCYRLHREALAGMKS